MSKAPRETCDDIMTTFAIAMATYADEIMRLAAAIGRATPEQIARLGTLPEAAGIEDAIEALPPSEGGK